jgi:hypothetical protein
MFPLPVGDGGGQEGGAETKRKRGSLGEVEDGGEDEARAGEARRAGKKKKRKLTPSPTGPPRELLQLPHPPSSPSSSSSAVALPVFPPSAIAQTGASVLKPAVAPPSTSGGLGQGDAGRKGGTVPPFFLPLCPHAPLLPSPVGFDEGGREEGREGGREGGRTFYTLEQPSSGGEGKGTFLYLQAWTLTHARTALAESLKVSGKGGREGGREGGRRETKNAAGPPYLLSPLAPFSSLPPSLSVVRLS